MPALALTDLANVFGLVKFYRRRAAPGIKPIVGCDVWITHDAERDQPYRAAAAGRSRAPAICKLCDWLTRAYRAQPASRPRRDPARMVRRGHRRPDRAVRRARRRRRPGAAARQRRRGARAAARAMVGALSRTLLPRGAARRPRRRRRAGRRHGARSRASSRCRSWRRIRCSSCDRDDFRAHEARVCIAEGYVLADPRRPRRFTPEQYFKTQAEMAATFADLPRGAREQRRDRPALQPDDRARQAIPAGVSDARRRRRSTSTCATKRPRGSSGGWRSSIPTPRAARRASDPSTRRGSSSRPGTIVQMGFPGYFLIVADFINWAKRNGVPVGPGRGSGAGSLVAYSLGITDLDPLRYDLLFERFLNPERVSMPDFDIDFCQDGRDRVIDYVKQKYGADSVSQIATFGTMAARAVVRDVGRVLDLPYHVRRRHRQADSVPARQAGDAEAPPSGEPRVERHLRARDRAAARGARRGRGGGARAAGAGRAARGPDAQRRHARGRRADRAGQAHRLLPAVLRRAPTRSCRSSTRTTSRRSAWSSSTSSA